MDVFIGQWVFITILDTYKRKLHLLDYRIYRRTGFLNFAEEVLIVNEFIEKQRLSIKTLNF